MKKLLSILISLLPFTTSAQQCNCLLNFDYMVSHIKTDYAGYKDKIKVNNKEVFENFTDSLRKKSVEINNIDSYYIVLRTWTNFFKDSHLRVQLDWRYRQKYPESVKLLNTKFAKPKNITTSIEKLELKTDIKIPDDKTVILRFPSFEWNEKKVIDSLLKIYKEQLKKSPNWIIDLRGNAGGIDYAFAELMPYIYTNPIKIKPDEYLSTEENIKILTETQRVLQNRFC